MGGPQTMAEGKKEAETEPIWQVGGTLHVKYGWWKTGGRESTSHRSKKGWTAGTGFKASQIKKEKMGMKQPAAPGTKPAGTSTETIEEKVARLERENEQLKADGGGGAGEFTIKTNSKGGLMINTGTGGFPICGPKAKIITLLDHEGEIREYIKKNDKNLK